jgi:hypothetical protein
MAPFFETKETPMRLVSMLIVGLLGGYLSASPTSAQSGQPQNETYTREQANQHGIREFDKKNFAGALYWFRYSAERGFGPAQASLGLMYRRGWGVPKDCALGLEWMTKAAETGEASAQFMVAGLNLRGECGSPDYTAALKWALKAAEQNYAPAYLLLFNMYAQGQGVEKDQTAALAWLQKAGGKTQVEGSQAAQAESPPASRPDYVFWCDLPTIGRDPVRALVSIDTKTKRVKIEGAKEGTYEFRDGAFGKFVTGFMESDYGAGRQFVEVSGDVVRFGVINEGHRSDMTIELLTGIMRVTGHLVECTRPSTR